MCLVELSSELSRQFDEQSLLSATEQLQIKFPSPTKLHILAEGRRLKSGMHQVLAFNILQNIAQRLSPAIKLYIYEYV